MRRDNLPGIILPMANWSAEDVPGWGEEYTVPTGNNSGGVSAGDVVETVGGFVGVVMSVVEGIARIKREDGQIEEAPVSQVIVVPPPAPPAAPATDWMPMVIGGGLLLILAVMAMGARR